MPSIAPRERAGTGSRDSVKTLLVVAALIVGEERILVTRRKKDTSYGLLWEFPGGKIEKEEEPRQALQRELKEELGIRVEVRDLFEVVFHDYSDYSVLLLVYRCRIEEGIPEPLGCHELRWVKPGEITGLGMLPADQSIQKRLSSYG
jgi:8-oxo-dGTP diphosphatase